MSPLMPLIQEAVTEWLGSPAFPGMENQPQLSGLIYDKVSDLVGRTCDTFIEHPDAQVSWTALQMKRAILGEQAVKEQLK